MYRRIYDCVVYDGQLDGLLRRLRELEDVVDVFVVVESTYDNHGRRKVLHLREQWTAISAFARDLRYIVVDEDVEGSTPASRERWLGDNISRGLADARASDIIYLSDDLAVPPPKALGRLREKRSSNVAFPHGCAVPYSALAGHTPSDLWLGIREGSIPARVVATPARRPAQHGTDRSSAAPSTTRVRPEPVIICPYLHAKDKDCVVEAFGLASTPGSTLPFYFWQDEHRIGPERAFEHCWSQFPDRDVIIVHTDMRPLPHQSGVEWYRDLLSAVDALPGAAVVACDLLFPDRGPDGDWEVQCAGGFFADGRFGYIGGRRESETGRVATTYGPQFARPRAVPWVTFGGIYIRREAIDMVGPFDKRYEWAYVMDVDYCVEAAVRGLTMVQVPVNLIHAENSTTREFLEQESYRSKVDANVEKFYTKWSWFLDSLPAPSEIAVPAR